MFGAFLWIYPVAAIPFSTKLNRYGSNHFTQPAYRQKEVFL